MNTPDQPTLAPTPRTDAAYFQSGATMYSLAGEMKLLERELTAAKAECDLNRNRLASILWSGAIDKRTCGDVQQWADDYTAELARLHALSDQLSDNLSAVGAAYNDEKARAEMAEASAKLWEADALRYANNTEFWKARAEKAEAEREEQRWLKECSVKRTRELMKEASK
jgi:hypothetical protein